MDERRVMSSAKEEEGGSAREHGDEDIPDWTAWLRSRLERVSSSERTAADRAEAAPEVVVADEQPEKSADEEHVLPDPTAPSEPAPPAPEPAPEPAPSPPEPAAPPPPAPAPMAASGADSFLGSETEALRAAVTALTAGMGALTDTFTGFREVVIERLHEYSETVQRVTERTAAEIEDNRRLQATTNAELRQNDAEVGERLLRLAEGMESLVAIRGDDERWAEVMGRLLDEVDAERPAGEREVLVAGGVLERLDGLEESLARIAAEVSEGMSRAADALDAEHRAREREALSATKVIGRMDELDQALRQITADVARASDRRDETHPPTRAVRASGAGTRTSSPSSSTPPDRAQRRRAAPLRAERPTRVSRPRPDVG